MENGYPQTRAPAQIDWSELFFSSTGRMTRGTFLLAVAVLVGTFALYEKAVGGLAHGLTAWAVHGLLLSCGACVLSKRLHDRGRAGWWAAAVLLAFIVVWPEPEGLSDFLFALPLIWAAVELGAMPGEPGPNRFGAPNSP